MHEKIPDYEVRVNGHPLVRVSDGDVCVEGKNFHADLRALSSLVAMLNDVLDTAEKEARPKAVQAQQH
jgi:hypothetical protein